MKLGKRLRRLERAAAARAPAPRRPDPAAHDAAYRADLRGAGLRPPDPPGPPGFDPAAWESRMRLGRCLDARLTGELAAGEYLPGLGADERRDADAAVAVLLQMKRDREGAGPAE
jgi:hypothetical protein